MCIRVPVISVCQEYPYKSWRELRERQTPSDKQRSDPATLEFSFIKINLDSGHRNTQ